MLGSRNVFRQVARWHLQGTRREGNRVPGQVEGAQAGSAHLHRKNNMQKKAAEEGRRQAKAEGGNRKARSKTECRYRHEEQEQTEGRRTNNVVCVHVRRQEPARIW
jgi:hypothetical protein